MMRVVSTKSATCWTLPLHSSATSLQRATATAKPQPATFVRSLLLKGLRTCLGTLMIPSILLGTQAGDAWDWEFSYDRVSNAKSVTYVVEQTNARRFCEGTIDYWCPTDNGAEARISQLFAFTNTIQRARLSAQYICQFFTFHQRTSQPLGIQERDPLGAPRERPHPNGRRPRRRLRGAPSR